MALKFAHTSDWQWGMTRHFLKGEAQSRYTQARFDAVHEAGRVAAAHGCAFMVAAGDVFDDNLLEPQIVLRGLECLSELDPLPIYLLPGNHDPLDATAIFRSPEFLSRCPSNVHVLGSPEIVEAAPHVDLVPAPWTAKRPSTDPVTPVLDGLEHIPGRTRIVIGHGQVDTLNPNRLDPTLVRLDDLEEAIHNGLVHYVALGDRHSTTPLGTTGRIWYSGTPEVTSYTEKEPGNILIVELDGAAAHVAPSRVGQWSFHELQFEATRSDDVERIGQQLSDISDKTRTVVKLALSGTLGIADHARLQTVLGTASTLFAAVEQWERHSDLHVLPDLSDLDHLGLTGFASVALDELTQQATANAVTASQAQDALMLLYRLAGGGHAR
ncbi:metallophosphoesterase family protein [Saccharopolyspora hattusasensis]|uniref:metallophosphoesterase family protein n=1 Tax=Saccharopolyspora hattusasensis TaxID=1128679 RepID=UPI003D965DE8